MLRRDRKLFALVATLALAFGLLQPLVASAAGLDRSWSICTTVATADDPTGGGLPAHADRCQLCIAGHVCGFHLAAATPYKPSATLAPAARTSQPLSFFDEGPPAGRDDDPPPSIRAPPLSA